MVEEPSEDAEWWLDARTRAAAEKALNLSESLTFTVYEARPLRLSRVQVSAAALGRLRVSSSVHAVCVSLRPAATAGDQLTSAVGESEHVYAFRWL